ncbi:sensor histidine kinase [Desulfosarcina sp. BuS5]|uniref:sensor histidine kinase n=1 Tax=Desulfosarcina sp. BuS5 TaxID=933262 RepID=UPI00047F21DC|nr:ATP-binding protein [Desulfosarcina sp. BuS5]
MKTVVDYLITPKEYGGRLSGKKQKDVKLFAGRLKTYFTINTAFFLFIGMLLIDLVIVKLDQKVLLKSEILKGFFLLSAFESSLQQSAEEENSFFSIKTKCLFRTFLKESGFNFALFIDMQKRKYFFGKCEINRNKLVVLSKKAGLTEKRIISFSDSIRSGSIWGVLWKEQRYLIIFSPLSINKDSSASVSIVLDLVKIYNQTGQTQKIIFIYLLINTAILTFISVKRISRATVTPLKRLLNNAEEFREDGDMFLIHAKESDEFSRLSSSLNRMLQRIANDKEKLRVTVRSLEKTNLKLKEAQKELVKAEKLASVGRLSAGIAHEIGNPISIIIGYLELLKQQNISNNEKNDFLHRAKDEINRINTIIRQLLDFSRTSEENIKNISVHEIINDISQISKIQPWLSGITIELRLAAAKDTINADSNQLRQVFMNLIINASDSIASSPEKIKGKIYITTENIEKIFFGAAEPVQMLKIMFTDNGPGISEADIENIFDPFYTTKEPGKGTGLGLYVCFMIIDKMSGKIEVKSSEYNTTISITLPLLNHHF